MQELKPSDRARIVDAPDAFAHFLGQTGSVIPKGANGRMAAAKAKTPRLARKWGYLMNMELETFASAFAKHASGR